jgi:large subunit ribosomal protein L6
MSRIGKMPIPLPDKVTMAVKPGSVEVSGPLGKFAQTLPPHTKVKIDQNVAHVELDGLNDEDGGALHGLARSLVFNAVQGVTQGYKKDLEIIGLGYRAQAQGNKLTLQLGFAHPVDFPIPAGLKVAVDPKQTIISISGIDKYLVGETAARIRRLKKPEPYKGSGIRYVGEHIIKKAGKAAAGAAGATGGAGAKK